MHQEELAIGQVEGRPRQAVRRQDIRLNELKRRAAFRVQIRQRLPPEAAVDLEPGDVARLADPVRRAA